MPRDEFLAALEDATGVVFGTWHYGHDAIAEAGDSLRYIYEVAGGLKHPGLDYAACFERGISVGGCAPAFGPVVAEMALAHVIENKVEAAYRRGDLFQKRAKMMEAWATYLFTPNSSSKLVTLTRQRQG